MLAFKGDPDTVRGDFTDRRCFPVYIALRYLYRPVKCIPTIGLSSDRIDKIIGKTHSISPRCAALKLNTVKRSDDLSNKHSHDKCSQRATFIFRVRLLGCNFTKHFKSNFEITKRSER